MTATHRLTLDLPGEVFAKLERAAEVMHRSIHDEAVELLARVVPEDMLLPMKTRIALANLPLLDDAALWKAARKRASTRSMGLWRSLMAKRETGSLTAEDEQLLDALDQEFQRTMLIRAEAALLLSERGHDIAVLGPRA